MMQKATSTRSCKITFRIHGKREELKSISTFKVSGREKISGIKRNASEKENLSINY